MTEKKKRTVVISSLCGILLLMIAGYAAFNTLLNIEGTTSISSNWNVLITNIEEKNKVGDASTIEGYPTHDTLTATFQTNLVSPGDSIEYDITVENQGNLNAELARIKVSDPDNEAIKFTTSGLEKGNILEASGKAILTVKVEYNDEVTSQPENLTANLTVTLDYVEEGHSELFPLGYKLKYEKGDNVTNIGEKLATCPMEQEECKIELPSIEVEDPDNYIGVWQNESGEIVGRAGEQYTITKDETLTAVRIKMPAADMLKKNIVTSGEGLYKDTYEEGRYVYKGGNPNNYITFNGETAKWRIMSVEQDNTIKIVRISQTSQVYFDTPGARTTGYCSGRSSTGCHVWAKTDNFCFNGQCGKVDKDSTMKTYLNTTFYNTLSTEARSQIVEGKFYYGGALLNMNLKDQITAEKQYSAASYVGLYQASEVIRASSGGASCHDYAYQYSNGSLCGNLNWMHKSASTYFWSLTPGLGSGNSYASVWISYPGSSSGYMTSNSNQTNDTDEREHPVVYLKASTIITGAGTTGNPYKIAS